MAKVTTRQGLVDHALRALGAPVIEINVDDDQLDDRIDDALQYYQEYHSDAVVRTYLKHQLVADDITNSYITIPDSVTSIVRLLDIRSGSAEVLFNVEYQMRLADVMNLSASSKGLQMYEQRRQHLALLDHRLNSTELLRFNRHMNRLHIDEGFGDLAVGDWIVVEAYSIVDPVTYTDVYNDMYLKRYVTALIKRQWGQNLIKFEGMQLPGGVVINGRQIFDDAVEEINKLEEDMQLAWQLPDDFLVG
jgi:hypothetical protein